MKFPPTTQECRIAEIFSSLQGEGPHLGERHLFVRFEECHIHCQYCDELGKPATQKTLEEVLGEIRRLDETEGPHRFVSLTGGEPLLYLVFLKPLLQRLKQEGFRTYLETNGILWCALAEVLEWCDCIAMDMKPSSVTKEGNFDLDHRRFLEVAKAKETFIKIIVSREIEISEFQSQVEIIRETAPETVLILQPISTEIAPGPTGQEARREGHEDSELMELLSQMQRLAMTRLAHVRIVPRLHKILHIP